MQKIRIGTTFSGIGAVEHALQRLNIDHNIIFACDNGGINLFNKQVEDRFQIIEQELSYLKLHITSINIDKNQLLEQLQVIETSYYELKPRCKTISINSKIIDLINEVLIFLKTKKDNKFKEYFSIDNLDISDYIYICLDLKNYLKKSLYKELDKEYEILVEISKNKEYRAIRRELKDIAKKFSQLHETITTMEIREKLNKIDSYDSKKEYIDNLYSKKTNNVKITYCENYFIDDKDFHQNIAFLDGKQYKNKIDLYVGGSPCQSFSIVGKRGGFEDTRGTLFYEYARVLKESQPRFFIYENVKGVLSHDSGQTWDTMKNTFDDTGYMFKDYILNAKNFGIPQHRERLFVIGFKYKKDFNKFKDPQTTILNSTMQDFLEDSVEEKYFLEKKGVEFVTNNKNLMKKYTQINGNIALCQKANQQFNWHGDFIEEYTTEEIEAMQKIDNKYFLSENVKNYVLDKTFYMNNKASENLIDLQIARPLTATMHKMHRAGVDNYISYGKKLDAKNRRIRKLTPRECFRLMGFCDSFKLPVSDTQLYHQAGNSIVVDVLISIINELMEIKS